jgi:hypothetical protein
MKFYETHYEDYLNSYKIYNLHPELLPYFEKFPQHISQLTNLIFYGPPGSGKYTQALAAIQKYSPSGLSNDKKISIQNEKYDYTYHISDIHYEIDMSLLGCNSKLIWHDIMQQIVDIVSVTPSRIENAKSNVTLPLETDFVPQQSLSDRQIGKCAIIMCKNFHMIHTELLEIFYSYIQEYNSKFSPIHLKYLIITEHLSFIPNNILSSCEIISVKRPNREKYIELIGAMQLHKPRKYVKSSAAEDVAIATTMDEDFTQKIGNLRNNGYTDMAKAIVNETAVNEIVNLKELRYFSKLASIDAVPADIFNIVCNNIIEQLLTPSKLVHAQFRDALYDIFVYNLDVVECVWHILCNLIENGHLKGESISDVMTRSYNFLKYFNNNYRPIYHLESMFHYMIIKINEFNELSQSM